MMANPFLSHDFNRLNMSINRMVLAEVPDIYNFVSFKGKTAGEVFSLEQLINEIRSRSDRLEMDFGELEEKLLPVMLGERLKGKSSNVRLEAEMILEDFGRRLGLIAFTLKEGWKENRKARSEWKDEHWDYWCNIEKLILIGGLSKGLIGDKLLFNAKRLLDELGCERLELCRYPEYREEALLGCGMKVHGICKYALVFDFGQSYIKRGIAGYNNELINSLEILPKVRSQYMKGNYDDPDLEMLEAECLHNNIVSAISDSYKLALSKNYEISNQINISIANYTEEGTLKKRGGYGKLMRLTDNYEELLSSELSDMLKRNISTRLFHDGEVGAVVFLDIPNSAVLSIGTAFGIGFPQNSGISKRISEQIEFIKHEQDGDAYLMSLNSIY